MRINTLWYIISFSVVLKPWPISFNGKSLLCSWWCSILLFHSKLWGEINQSINLKGRVSANLGWIGFCFDHHCTWQGATFRVSSSLPIPDTDWYGVFLQFFGISILLTSIAWVAPGILFPRVGVGASPQKCPRCRRGDLGPQGESHERSGDAGAPLEDLPPVGEWLVNANWGSYS